jgi:hypothetical protein
MDFISQIIDEVIESVLEERWLPIVGYEDYKVSDLGRLKNKHSRILQPTITNKGYNRATLCKKSIQNRYLVHRLVLQAFNPTEEELVCDHINHIRNDNRLCNLRWATQSQNLRYKKKMTNCSSQYLGVCKKGKKWEVDCSVNSKLIYIGRYNTEEEAAKAYNDFVIKNNLQDFTFLNKF